MGFCVNDGIAKRDEVIKLRTKAGSVVERKRESHCRWRGDWWMHTMLSTFKFQVRYIRYDHTKSCQYQFLIPFNGASQMAYCITSHRRKCMCIVDSEYLGESQEFICFGGVFPVPRRSRVVCVVSANSYLVEHVAYQKSRSVSYTGYASSTKLAWVSDQQNITVRSRKIAPFSLA